MSRLLLTTWDGAGTTPPLMDVVRALVRRGHDVRVLGDLSLRAEVEAAGGEHVPWTRAPQRREPGREGDHVRDWEAEGPVGALRRVVQRVAVGPAREHALDVLAEVERERPDLLLTEVFLLGPLVAAEAAGLPAVVLNPTVNMLPVPGVPPLGPGLLPSQRPEDQEVHRQVAALGAAAWEEALPALDAARAACGLPPLPSVLQQGASAARVLVMTSAALDWTGPVPPAVRWVGPRLGDPAWAGSWSPPPGDAPLVLASLSSDFQDQEAALQRVVNALAQLPARAVVTTGRGVDPAGLRAPRDVQVVRAAPHREVLRHAAAVVTHGGHGTVVKALAAGVPLIVVPMGRDQHDVAARVVHAGAGVRLDAGSAPEALAAAVRQVLEQPSFRERAQAVAAVIAEETREDRVVAEVEALLVPVSSGR